ncbi:MAG: AAA family ATPase [Actinomycetes bacterium]
MSDTDVPAPADLTTAVGRVRELADRADATLANQAGNTSVMPGWLRDDAADIAAAVLSAGAGGAAQVALWSAATGYSATLFNRSRTSGAQWQSEPTTRLKILRSIDPASAAGYAQGLADLADRAAHITPADPDRERVASFIAASQMRALAPSHGQTPPASISTIEAFVRQAPPVSLDQILSIARNGGVTPPGGARSGDPTRTPSTDLPPLPPGASPPPVTQGEASPGSQPRPAEPSTGAPTAASSRSEATDSAAATAVATAEPAETYEELLTQLDALVGLESVKSEVSQQAELLRVAKLRAGRQMKNPDVTRHLIFTGNPGTGKTTVARLVAKIYRSLGLLEKGHLVELDRTGLVAGYLGQTEAKTAEAVKSALGGVLFIDEAYSLAGDQYGDAAVSVLVKAIEDHRDDLVLIAAGYTDRMEEFLDMNPGLASRLRLTIFFPDYTDDELIEIFKRIAKSSDYKPTEGCVKALRTLIASTPHDETFGNARFVRSTFEAALVRQAWRLRKEDAPTDDQLRQLTAADIAKPATEPPLPAPPTFPL